MKKKRRRKLLIDLRKRRDWTQQQTADALGISTSRYGMYEVGSRTPQPSMMKAIADLFGKDIMEIFADAFIDSEAEEEMAATAEPATDA